MNDQIGAGWSFKLDLNQRGGILLASGSRKVEQSISIILGTRIGERVMRPTFGCRLHELVFAPFDAETLGLAERYVTEALNFWEPRIDVLETRGARPEKSARLSLDHDPLPDQGNQRRT